MSDKRINVRIAKPVFTQLQRFAKSKDLDLVEAADVLIQGDINRRAALAKFAAKVKSKPAARKAAPKTVAKPAAASA